MNEAILHTEVFEAETVQRLCALAFRLGDVERLLATFRERYAAWLDAEREAKQLSVTSTNTNEVRLGRERADTAKKDLDGLAFTVKAHARWAHQRVIPLVESLRRAGGINPPPDTENAITKGDPLTLEANPFAEDE